MEFGNWLIKLAQGEMGSWPSAADSARLKAAMWGPDTGSNWVMFIFFCFVKMCSSSQELVADCSQAIAAVKKAPI